MAAQMPGSNRAAARARAAADIDRELAPPSRPLDSQAEEAAGAPSPLETVIGLEVHIQLQTRSKIFCGCKNQFGGEANNQVCPVCLGLPGALPVLNATAVDFAAQLALATGCRINPVSVFARKNYFYPDLPKGYQISQFDQPFAENGEITLSGEERPIRVRRIHLEEDAGKSIHAESYVAADETLLDLNRCGVPLLELVTEPDLRTPAEAAAFMQLMRQLVRYLGISSGNMEEGSLRCDANISLRPASSLELGVKTELKNMNSFRHVERALTFEIERQTALLRAGAAIHQETLLWDPGRGVAEPMRSKEEAHDYRYFPEPDLMPVTVDEAWIVRQRERLPELPAAKRRRYEQVNGLPAYDAGVLSEDPQVADYYDRLCLHLEDKKLASNWVMGEVLRAAKARGVPVAALKAAPHHLGEILSAMSSGRIHAQSAKKIFERLLETGEAPSGLIAAESAGQIDSEGELIGIIGAVLAAHPDEVTAWREGKEKVIGFLTGAVMQKTAGRANPRRVMELLRQELTGRQR